MTETTALLLSMAIEAPIGYLVARLARWPCRGALHVGLACAVATAVTHPQLWTAAYWAFQYYSYWPSVLALEIAVVVAEGLLIAWMAQFDSGAGDVGFAHRQFLLVCRRLDALRLTTGRRHIGKQPYRPRERRSRRDNPY